MSVRSIRPALILMSFGKGRAKKVQGALLDPPAAGSERAPSGRWKRHRWQAVRSKPLWPPPRCPHRCPATHSNPPKPISRILTRHPDIIRTRRNTSATQPLQGAGQPRAAILPQASLAFGCDARGRAAARNPRRRTVSSWAGGRVANGPLTHPTFHPASGRVCQTRQAWTAPPKSPARRRFQTRRHRRLRHEARARPGVERIVCLGVPRRYPERILALRPKGTARSKWQTRPRRTIGFRTSGS